MKRPNKYTDEKPEDLYDINFCTECEEELDSIGISKERSDVVKWKKNFTNCRNTGKFNGEMCSRMFITAFDDGSLPDEEDD